MGNLNSTVISQQTSRGLLTMDATPMLNFANVYTPETCGVEFQRVMDQLVLHFNSSPQAESLQDREQFNYIYQFMAAMRDTVASYQIHKPG